MLNDGEERRKAGLRQREAMGEITHGMLNERGRGGTFRTEATETQRRMEGAPLCPVLSSKMAFLFTVHPSFLIQHSAFRIPHLSEAIKVSPSGRHSLPH